MEFGSSDYYNRSTIPRHCQSSGRSTTLDAPYWYVGIVFVVLAILSIFIQTNPLKNTKRVTQTNHKEVYGKA